MAGGRDMTLQVVVRLRDELGSGLGALLGRIRAFGAQAKTVFGNITSTIGNIAGKLGALGIGVNIGLGSGLESFVKMDSAVRDIGITLQKSGQELEKFVSSGIKLTETLAKKTGQTSEAISAAWLEYAKLGNMSEEQQKAFLGPTAKAATAAGASPVDMAKLAGALSQNANIKTGEDLERAFAILIQAGKLGAVELKDMVSFLPKLLADQQNIGMTGLKSVVALAANIEISKRTAGTPDQAATNYGDFMQTITAPHTVKRFKDHGVDLPGVLKDAALKGINPIEAVLQKVGKIINQPKVVAEAMARAKKAGLDPTRTQQEIYDAVDQAVKAKGLGELFHNQFDKAFAMAMLANVKDYLEMTKALGNGNTAITDQDFKSRMESPEVKQRMATEKIEQLMRRFGSSLQELFGWVDRAATAVQGWVAALDDINPKIVDFGVKLAALISTIGGLMFVANLGGGAGLKGAATAAGSGVGWFAGLLGRIALPATAAYGFRSYAAKGAEDFHKETGQNPADHPAEVAKHGAANAVADFGVWIAGLFGVSPEQAASNLEAHVAARKKAQDAAAQAVRPSYGVVPPDRLDVADIERARRSEADWRQYPEAARGRQMMRPQAAPAQEVKVGGSITVKVDGPGQITGVSSSNANVPLSADRGQNGQRP